MKLSVTKNLAIVLTLLTLTVGAATQISDRQKAEIDGLFTDYTSETPGAAVGVIRDGKLIYSKGYGMADLEHDVPLSPKSVFYMASVSKQFVTFAVLLLEEEGKLGLDDEIQKHLPDFPRYKDPLTIRHFIHHTSGVRDSLELWSLSGKDIYDTVDKEAMYELLKRQKELNFTPGDKYLYSNACYFMLALIVEKVSGKSIREFAEEEMFGPLGMKNTHFHDDQYHIVKNRVFSYEPGKEGYRNLIMRFDLVGSGGLYSSIEDLYLWDQNFYNNKLGKGRQELIDLMQTDGKLNNGKSAGYAFGVSNGTHKGLRTVEHGGALAGYRTYSLRYPDENFSVFVLANVANFNPGGKSRSIAEIFLKDRFKAEPASKPVSNAADSEPPKATEVKLTPEELTKFVSLYWSDEASTSVRIRVKEGVLKFQQEGGPELDMAALSKKEFKLAGVPVNARIRFEVDESGKRLIDVTVNDAAPIRGFAYEQVDYSAADLKAFAGTYFSEEIRAFYILKVEGENLVLYINDKNSGSLKPIMKNRFSSAEAQTFSFVEDDSDNIAGFKLDAGRVRNLKFLKQ